MKFFFPAFFVLFLSLNLYCQHAQITFSDDFKIAEKEYKDQTVAHSVYHKNSFYTATNSGVSMGKWLFTKLYDVKFAITIAKFDRSMNKIKEIELENGSKSFGPLMPELLLLNNQLFLAYFQSDSKTSFSLFLALVDETGLTIKKSKKICTIRQENVGIFKIMEVLKGGLVYFCNSADNKKILVACKSSPNNLQTLVADDSLSIVKQTNVSIPNSEFQISSAVLTADNLECMVLDSEHETKIVYISPDGKKSQKTLKASGNLNPCFTNVTLSRDGKSIYIYSATSVSGGDDDACNGLLISQLDCSTLQLSRQMAYEFPPEFIQTISEKGGGSARKKEYAMFTFTPVLVELGNGTIAILGCPEKVNISISTSAPNMNGQTSTVATTTLNVGPVIAFFPDLNGKSFEYVIVPRRIVFSKRQRSGSGAIQIVQAPGMSHSSASFFTARSGDDIVIFYNDNETNLAKNENEKIKSTYNPYNLVLAEAVINKDKKLQYRKQVGENLKDNKTYYLGYAVPNSSSSVVFPVGKEGVGFNAMKMFFTNWCFIDIK